jgi:hypothetical protein
MLTGLLFASCEDYLTPELADQITQEEIFSKRPTTERFLAQVYSYLPRDYDVLNATTPRSDEAYFSWTAWVGYLGHNDGSWNPTTTNYHTWSNYYLGINQATVFIDNVDQCLEVSATERAIMKAEARFLRAFFYNKLIEQYGPVYIWGDQAPDLTIVNSEIDRHPLDACIDFVAGQYDEAALVLPERITDPKWYGRVTKGAALAMKARLLLYAARPLFNGCALYRGMKNYYGDYLFPQSPDPEKWEKAAQAAKAVIDLNVYSLYEASGASDPFKKGIESYMGIYLQKWNNELIFARWEGDSYYWQVRAAPPVVLREGYGGFAPSLKLVDTYPMGASGRYPITGYQSNGTPIVDPLSGYSDQGFTNNYIHPIDGQPFNAHNSCVGRDARFYASILANGMNWINTFGGLKKVTFHAGGTSPFGSQTGDYVKVGYLFRRMSNPANDTEKGSWGNGYSWPYIRFAEIYLDYAEACNEKPNRNEADALFYLNKVRNRSGLNNIEVAYPEVKGNQTLLRELLRKERMVEMAFENLRYYDIRTWMIADKESNGPRYGLNLLATNYEDSWTRTDEICLPIVFQPKHYLFPIYQGQLEEMKNLTQNYGW